jgi:hypothetical protein
MKTQAQRVLGLETEVIDGVAVQVGRDPRKMSPDDLRGVGHEPLSVLQALRHVVSTAVRVASRRSGAAFL